MTQRQLAFLMRVAQLTTITLAVQLLVQWAIFGAPPTFAGRVIDMALLLSFDLVLNTWFLRHWHTRRAPWEL